MGAAPLRRPAGSKRRTRPLAGGLRVTQTRPRVRWEPGLRGSTRASRCMQVLCTHLQAYVGHCPPQQPAPLPVQPLPLRERERPPPSGSPGLLRVL